MSKKQIGISSLTFFVVFTLSFIGSTILFGNSFKKSDNEQQPTTNSYIPPTAAEGIVNIALVGHGGAGHAGGGLADSILLVSLDISEKKAKIVSIPRDLWFDGNKVNDTFAQSPEKLIGAIEKITGLHTEYFMSVDFVSFKRAIATIGGITVDVPETFDDYFYPIEGEELNTCGFSPEKMQEVHEKYTGFELEKQFACRYEHLHFEQGPVHMEGGDALAFVRSRHSGQHGGDFARSERQHALLLALRDKLFDLDVLKDIPNFFDEMIKFVSTNLDVDAITKIAEMIINPKEYEIDHIYLTTENVLNEGKSSGGAYILYPKAGMENWEEIRKLLK